MGLSGVSYTGMDVGGFTGGPSPSLFAKWVSIGAFSPFFRIHSAIDTKEADAWSFGEKVESVCKSYISLRYRMLPYLYSAFAESNTTGLPVNRSLAISHSHDGRIYDGRFHNQFMHGPSILVAPNESNKEFTKVYLPDDQGWYDLYTDKMYKGKEEIVVESPIERLPVFVRGGSIIPMQSLTMSTMIAPTDTLQLHVYNGKAGIPYTYYEDDGEAYGYEKGEYMRRTIKLDVAGRKIAFGKPEGSRGSKFKHIKIHLHGFASLPKIAGKDDRTQFIDPLPNNDPIGTGQPAPTAATKSIVIPMPAGALETKF
jgi:alpha-glucosidase